MKFENIEKDCVVNVSKIPITKHSIVKYRNGEFGKLLTSARMETKFSILTIRDKDNSVIHHMEDGKCSLSGDDYFLDIIGISWKHL